MRQLRCVVDQHRPGRDGPALAKLTTGRHFFSADSVTNPAATENWGVYFSRRTAEARAVPHSLISSQKLSRLSFRPPSRQHRPLPHQGRKHDELRADVKSAARSIGTWCRLLLRLYINMCCCCFFNVCFCLQIVQTGRGQTELCRCFSVFCDPSDLASQSVHDTQNFHHMNNLNQYFEIVIQRRFCHRVSEPDKANG